MEQVIEPLDKIF